MNRYGLLHFILVTTSFIYAQKGMADTVFSGQVRSEVSKEILAFANIRLEGKKTFMTVSDEDGEFKLTGVPSGDYEITCSYIGYKNYKTSVSINQSSHIFIELMSDNKLHEVVVTATESKGIASASRIDREAMSHLQPTSFTDLLELLPGNISRDPNMGAANNILLRETGNLTATGDRSGSSSPNYAISSLGTLFMIDGAPVNTDANMQEIPGNVSTAHDSRSAVNRGVDMRTISTDNIESVEIVRGIPSAEYGNLTSGLVNIKTIRKAGKVTARFKSDGYSKLFAAGKGFAVPDKNMIVNLDAGLLNAKIDPRNNYENYKRINASIRLTGTHNAESYIIKWTPNIDYTTSIDDVKQDPDLNYGGINEYKSSYNMIKFTNNIRWSFLKINFIKAIELNTSADTQFDRLEQRKLVAPTRYGLAPTGEDAGEHDAQLLFSEYIADYLCLGNPTNAFAKLKSDFTFNIYGVKNDAKLGAEYNFSKNFGKGQVYDISHPITSSGWHHRPRAYKDIPAAQNISIFAEDYITAKFSGNKLEAQAGIRTVNQPGINRQYAIQGKTYLDPRINVRWTMPPVQAGEHKVTFAISAGTGKTTRMPTLNYLYPNPHYTDMIQLGYYDINKPQEYSRFNILTYITDPTNYALQPARNTKHELRLEINAAENRLSIAAFTEEMTSGFRYSNTYKAYLYKDYDESTIVPSSLTAPPDIEKNIPYEMKKRLSGYSFAENGSRLKKEGIEFQLNSQRIKPLRTAITLSGAYFRSTYTNSRPMLETVSQVVNQIVISDRYIGLYDWDDGRINQQLSTNCMFDTQIPELGFIFSVNLQCMFFVKTQSIYKNGMPAAYLDVEDEQMHRYTDESQADTYLQHLVKNYQEDSFIQNKIPIAAYVNLKVTKKIDRFLELAMFVNRLIDYTPDYTTNGFTRRRNVDAYFGMELNFKL